uniref:CCHC-type domain-containing protein n=1 Tax=Heterorhabditis bacteriophora TaxID=37862 RepID=A0A1I7XNF3_HETBA
MFYACLAILLLFIVMCSCVTLAIIDLEMYNFGLYIVLLCIVGTMLACALCIANPQACPNPAWYTKFCLLLHEMYPVPPEGTSSPKMNGLRARMQQHAQSLATQSEDGTRLTLRQESRATVAMLAPAVHIMHQVWKGMAWVTDGIEEDEEDTRLYDKMEQGPSDEISGGSVVVKRLSTIAESSSYIREMEQTIIRMTRGCRGAGTMIGEDYWTSIGYDGVIRDGRSQNDFLSFPRDTNNYHDVFYGDARIQDHNFQGVSPLSQDFIEIIPSRSDAPPPNYFDERYGQDYRYIQDPRWNRSPQDQDYIHSTDQQNHNSPHDQEHKINQRIINSKYRSRFMQLPPGFPNEISKSWREVNMWLNNYSTKYLKKANGLFHIQATCSLYQSTTPYHLKRSIWKRIRDKDKEWVNINMKITNQTLIRKLICILGSYIEINLPGKVTLHICHRTPSPIRFISKDEEDEKNYKTA